MNIDELSNIVNKYIMLHRPRIDKHLAYYKNLKSLDKVIKDATAGKDDSNFKNPHQYRLENTVIGKQQAVLLSIKDK